jgi:two-component system NtrC family sensor kinase
MAFFPVGFGWLDQLARVDYLADTASTFFLLVAGIIIYRSFRERYLFFWIIGWSSYLLYQVALENAVEPPYNPLTVSLASAAFFVACSFFASAVFDYLQRSRALVLVWLPMLVGVAMATVRAYVAPTSAPLEWGVQILYRIGTFNAALQLALYSRGRRQLSSWLISAMLFLVHIDFDIFQPTNHAGLDVLVQSLLGLSMLVLVLDQSRVRNRRLDVISQIIDAMATAGNENVVILATIQAIKKLMDGSASWFRLINGDALEIRAHSAVSDEFLKTRWTISRHSNVGQALCAMKEATVFGRRNPAGEHRLVLMQEKLDHVISVPVQGKGAIIGYLSIGSAQPRRYRSDELRFLTAACRQLGVAIENLRLISKILQSQQQWAKTFDSMPDPIVVHDECFRVVKANRALLNKLGTSIDGVVGRSCEVVLPRFGGPWKNCPYCSLDPAAEFRDQPDPCFGGYATISTTQFTAEGNGAAGTVHIIRDTTARRAAEERYRTLFDQVQEGVFVSTPDGRVIDCNDAFVHLLGYASRDEILARDIAQSFYARPGDRNVFLQKMQKDGIVRNLEVTLRRKDGSFVTALENSYATKTSSGNIVRYHGVLLDISEKKRAEDEVHRRNRELEALNAIAVLASQSFDLDEIINVASRQLVDIFAADTASILLLDSERGLFRRIAASGQRTEFGSNFHQVQLTEEFSQQLVSGHVEILSECDSLRLPEPLEAYVRAEQLRSWLWVAMWSGEKIIGVLGVSSRTEAAYNDRDRGLMIALGRQLANSIEKVRLYEETSKAYEHLRRTQEQLLQSEKMSAVGQLISGVAHELNNPLTAILGYAQLLEGEPLSDRSQEYVGKLYKQAQRTHRVVQNLLSFARQRKPAKMPVDVRRIVEDTLALRDYDLNLQNIKVERNYAETMPAVVADAHQLEQVFLNIINNAVDAMLEHSRGGKLSVAILHQEGHASLEFHDSGPGIKELNRIFDPFYTTKSVGKGTGLGLSICYGIIKEHGGDIRAYNHPGGGAVIQVILPTVAAEAVAPAPAPVQPAGHAVPLQGRVLLVDDEEAVLEFEREVLSGAGAQVTCLTSGEVAISRLAAEQFDAVLVDSSMPGALNGIDIYRWIAEHRPESKSRVIVTFSSLADSDTRRFVEDNSVLHINKPFEVSDLIAVTSRAIFKQEAVANT